MTQQSKQPSSDRTGDVVLRALAISCVILIHVLSSIQPSPFYGNSGVWQWIVIGLDQAARISVPLFVALSGYGLWQGYGQKLSAVGTVPFLYRRVRKLVPAYVLWSVIFALVFLVFPNWTTPETQPSFPWQLVWGRADYHLYFVPMILQLYFLFPLLAWVQRRWPVALLLGALVVQLSWYAYYSYGEHVPLDLVFFKGDSEQYLWSPNWIWYFVLGMQLPAISQWLGRRVLARGGIAMVAVGVCLALVVNAVTAINSGVDPLLALRFTRYEIVLFASLAIISLLTWAHTVRHIPRSIQWLSDWSYHLYLSHTLFLRVIFNILLR